MAETPEAENYHLGWAAWDGYLARLQILQAADEKTIMDDMLGNSWIYECLVQYRRAVVSYLREITGEFDGDTAGHLLKAADLYAKMADEVLTDSEHCLLTIAPLPWSLKEGETWTETMRENQMKRLEAAYPLERAAISEIKMALAYASQSYDNLI